MMKKILKVIVLVLLFVLGFFAFQSVLRYHWASDTEQFYTRNVKYKESDLDYDVLFFGTSEIYHDCNPTAMYEEAGITGFNLAMTKRSPITEYYQLVYALRYHTPKVVVLDFTSLFNSRLPSKMQEANEEIGKEEQSNEIIYRKVIDTLPDADLKLKLIKAMKEVDPDTDALSYIFPIFRYHSRWDKLSQVDFEDQFADSEYYLEYCAGSFPTAKKFKVQELKEITPEIWDADKSDVSVNINKISEEYYKKMIALCEENNIQVVGLLLPKPRDAAIIEKRRQVIYDFLDENGVAVIDYNSYEEMERLGITDLKTYYYDASHLNYKGAVILSEDLADQLKGLYDLPDHRTIEKDKEVWDGYWDEFVKNYKIEK